MGEEKEMKEEGEKAAKNVQLIFGKFEQFFTFFAAILFVPSYLRRSCCAYKYLMFSLDDLFGSLFVLSYFRSKNCCNFPGNQNEHFC